MTTLATVEQTTESEPNTQTNLDTVAPIALDEVTGGWVYAVAYAPAYAPLRYAAQLERRAEWMVRRAERLERWLGY